MFGEFEFEEGRKVISPWRRQWAEDLERVWRFDEMQWAVEQMEADPRKIGEEGEVHERFPAFDRRRLKAVEKAREVPKNGDGGSSSLVFIRSGGTVITLFAGLPFYGKLQ